MELIWLEDYLALVREEGFSRAAEVRGVTQPAFSRRIQALERWLGVTLINRDTHRIGLTPAGERFVELAESTLRDLELGRCELREIAGVSRATLRVVATHVLSISFFPGWIRKLQALAGHELSVQLSADNMQAAEQLMLHGRAQFLLCHHHPSADTALNSRGFVSAALGIDRLIAVSAPDDVTGGPRHALPGTSAQPVASLEYGAESGLGRIVAAVHGTNGAPGYLAPAFTSHAVMVLSALARDGAGVAWLPHSLIEDDLAAGRLVRAGEEGWDIPVEIHLHRAACRQSAAAEAFWTLVTGMARERNAAGDHAEAPRPG